MTTMNIQVVNKFSSQQVFAYVTGQALDNGNHVCFISADAKTPYYPDSPSSTLTKLTKDCAIRLGPQGSTTNITIPHLAGARLWFSLEQPLTFLINPGPAIVEPSVTNPTDPNIAITWDFCELTFSNNVIYANISYVDFVSLPISLALTPPNGSVQSVLGLRPDGLSAIASGLQDSSLIASEDWKKCIYNGSKGEILRVLSANAANELHQKSLFKGYYDPYVNAVWDKYAQAPLTVDTQAEWQKLSANIQNGLLTFPGIGTFSKPSTADIFSCSTGPFASNVGALGPLTARISAAFNRSTLLILAVQPDGINVSQYYREPITNHYARLCHTANEDGRGYAFPYDDVLGQGVDQSGFVNGEVKQFVVTVG